MLPHQNKESKKYHCVLSIAGSDSSGGAGIQADIKTISALGCYAASVITALTAQNTCGVQSIYAVSPDFIAEQIRSVFDDIEIHIIKIGMLHTIETARAIITNIQAYPVRPIVLDPVMISKNGCPLLAPDTMSFLLDNILPHVFLITPNIHEAEKILGHMIETESDMAQAAKKIALYFNINVLIKGGHLQGAQSNDVLYEIKTKNIHWFREQRILTRHTHGTGCSLSSAIAAFLAKNHSLHDAILHAKNYLTQSLLSGNQYQLGRGCGPIDHFYFLRTPHNVS